MGKNIKKGDTCRIYWANTFGVDVVILHMPQGEGDLLQVEYVENGIVQAFSPSRIDYRLEKKVSPPFFM
jgi:hypothetical protein